MKRLFCLLLTALILFALCACTEKADVENSKKTEEQKATETKQETATENVVVDPAVGENDNPTEIGTLPIIFGDETENTEGGTDTPPTTTKQDGSSTTPPSTTKKPTTTTKAPTTSSSQTILGNNNGTVVETPIIPFN